MIRMRRAALMLFLVATSAGILAWLVYRERNVLLTYEWHIRWEAFLFAFGAYTLAIAIATWVWAGMMKALGSPLPLLTHFHYLSLSNLAKRLPGTLWYVVGRSQLYSQHGIPVRATSLASAMEMGTSVVSGVVVSLAFAVPIMLRYAVSPWWLVVVLIPSLALLHPRVLAWVLRRMGVGAASVPYSGVLAWIAAHAVVWIVGGCMLYGIVNVFAGVDWASVGYVVGSWSLVGVLSTLLLFSPSNLGVTELGLGLFLSGIVPGPIAVITALSVRITVIVFEIFWALLSVALFGRNRLLSAEKREETRP